MSFIPKVRTCPVLRKQTLGWHADCKHTYPMLRPTLGSVALCALVGSAAAQITPPPATYDIRYNAYATGPLLIPPGYPGAPLYYSTITNHQQVYTSGTIFSSTVGEFGDSTTAAVTVSEAPVPFISSSVTTIMGGSGQASGQSGGEIDTHFNYSFVINGQSAGIESVQLRIRAEALATLSGTGVGSTSGTDWQYRPGQAMAYGHINGLAHLGMIWLNNHKEPNGQIGADAGGSRETGYSGGFTFDQVTTASTNTVYTVELRTYTYATLHTLVGGHLEAKAYIDPFFEVVGPGADNYTISFSAGIGNQLPTSNVPDGGATMGFFAATLLTIAVFRRRV